MFPSTYRGLAALAAMAVIAGCTSTTQDGATPEPQQQAATAAVVQGTCPPVSLREGTAFYRDYGNGGTEGSPEDVRYQASIAATTRQCLLSGSEIGMTVTVAGRVAAGPAGGPGPVQLPIRVAVLRNGEVLYSEMQMYTVELPSNAPTTQFVYTDANVRIPADAVNSVRVYAGFDEGPYDTP